MKRQDKVGWFLHDIKNRGVTAWIAAIALMAFYVILYFGYPSANPTTSFQSFQNWLYVHFTHYLDELGGTLFGPIASHLTGTLAWAIPLAIVSVAGSYLAYYFRRDPPKVRTALVATAAAGVAMFVFMRLFFVGDSVSLGADDFNRWHIYGALYSVAILTGGTYVSWKYRHNAYQIVRTLIVMFIQVSFAFSIPTLLKFFHQPEYYFSYMWPLKIGNLDPNQFNGAFNYYGEVLVLYGFFASLLMVPVMTLLYGKRWYCSWVCGCGGLANTFGEPWRQLSSKSSLSWKIEKVTINAVLIIAISSTIVWLVSAMMPDQTALATTATKFRQYYGWVVVAGLSGALGTGLYPLMGTRVWCRYFCPMAALMGWIQKLGRFRIRVKDDMCISCGLCSKHCEMGIDVRSYAQLNTDFTRAACVGCGLCAEVCPRGVLRLENFLRRDPQELTMQSLLNESWK